MCCGDCDDRWQTNFYMMGVGRRKSSVKKLKNTDRPLDTRIQREKYLNWKHNMYRPLLVIITGFIKNQSFNFVSVNIFQSQYFRHFKPMIQGVPDNCTLFSFNFRIKMPQKSIHLKLIWFSPFKTEMGQHLINYILLILCIF